MCGWSPGCKDFFACGMFACGSTSKNASRRRAPRDTAPCVPLATAPGWADVVVGSPETPLLLVGEQQGRRVGVLGFDVHQSDLPLQPGFPVLMQHLLDWLVPRSSTATPVVQVGDSISLAPLPEAVNVDVVTPDGRRLQVGPPLPPPRKHASSSSTSPPNAG